MKYFVVLLVLATFFLSINLAYGLWLPQTTKELLEESQVVFVGTIASVNVLEFEESSTSYVEEDGIDKPVTENYILSLDEYSVNVEEFLKNPQNSTILTVRQPTTSIPGKIIPHGGFDVGDRVLFYIEELDGTNTYSKESFLIPEQCDSSLVIHEPRMIGGDFRMMQNGIEKKDNFTANSPIQLIAERDMGTLSGASISYDAYISKQVGKTYKERVFNQTIIADSKPCQWMSVATWEFTPDAGNYLLNGMMYEAKSSFGIGNTFFSVWPGPPLKQLNAGTSVNEIQCKENLVLIQKYDGSPACVTYQTGNVLVNRGWATCDDGISHGRGHPCGPRSSPGIIFDSDPEPEQAKEISDSNELPDDFDFKYSFGVDEKNIFDSKNNLFVADMVCDPAITKNLQLSDDEKMIIWESISDNQFFDLGEFTDNCNESGNCTLVEPESKITLSVTANGASHSVHYRDSYIGKTGEKFTAFKNIIDTIQKILDSKEEIKDLPTPRCGYM